MVVKNKDDQPDIDKIFPPEFFGRKTGSRVFDRNDLMKIINNSIDASKFGDETAQDAVKRTIEMRLREAQEARRAKPNEDVTTGDYLQVFARISALAAESYNNERSEQFLLLGRALSVLSGVGNDYMGLVAQDFAEARLDPKDYLRFVSVKGQRAPIKSSLGRDFAPPSGDDQRDTGTALSSLLSSEKKSLIEPTAAVRPPDVRSQPSSAQPAQVFVKEDMMTSAPSTLDAQSDAASFTNRIGYQILVRCDQLGLTSRQLADLLNQKIKVDTVKEEHVVAWQKDQNLDMLANDKALYDAVKHVLIEDNASFKNPIQKDRMNALFDALFAQAVQYSGLSSREHDELPVVFGTVAISLLEKRGFNDQAFAAKLNDRLSDSASKDRAAVSRQDIVDFQSGAKIPEKDLLLRLASLLELDPDKFVKSESAVLSVRAEAAAAKTVMTERADFDEAAFKARFREEVAAPLKEIYRAVDLGSKFDKELGGMMYSRPLLKGHPEDTSRDYIHGLLEDRIAKVLQPLPLASKNQCSRIIKRWRRLQAEFTEVYRASEAARPQKSAAAFARPTGAKPR